MIASFCESLDKFARANIDARKIDAAHRIDPSILEGLAELGVFGASIPEAYGGSELGLEGVCAVVTALARHDRSVATTVGLHLGLGTRGLVAFGSDALKEQWLPDIASGKKLAAFATTEAGAGSDLAAIRTRGMEVDGALVVNGEKIFVTNGGLADVYTITASTPGLGGARRGHSLLLLGKDDPGVKRGAEEDKLGLRGSSTNTMYFDDASIPLDRVIGVAGEGMTHLAHVLAWGRTAMAAGCIGSATAALEATVAHVAQRQQFGKTLDAFEVVQDQVSGMAATRFAMQAVVHAAATGPRLLSASTTAKILCSEGSWDITDMAIQLHGGSGYIEETGIALILRDARVTRIFEGANDVLRTHLGLLEATVPAERVRLTGVSPLGAAADALHDTLTELRTDAARRFGIKLGRQQRILHRLGELALLRDSCDAVVNLAIAPDASPQAADLAARWVHLAHLRSLAPISEFAVAASPVVPFTGVAHA